MALHGIEPKRYQPIPGVQIIGLGHKARQGKDTTADYLSNKLGYSMKFAFSDALYDVARAMFGMKEKDARLLQVLGTDIFRKKDPNTWLDALYYKLQDKRPETAIISDCRFPNEAQMVKDMGGSLIKVVRLNPDGTPYVDPSRDPNHPSECALDDYTGWDHILTASSLKELSIQQETLPFRN